MFCTPEPSNSYKKPSVYVAPPKYEYLPEIPHCALNTTKAWCLEDSEYPFQEVQQALDQHYQTIFSFYQEILANTVNSVDGLHRLKEEFYICPSSTDYVQPLRAINKDGKWRTIVNHVESYGISYTQTVRIEECSVVVGTTCPLVSSCYESKCVQKNIFHRFLVYDPYDYTLPFAIESFKLPSSCACVVGSFHL